MTKVAFYIDTAKLNRDWTLDISNQALSGTDSLMFQVAHYICEIEGAGTIYATSLPADGSNTQVHVVSGLIEAANLAASAGAERLIYVSRLNDEERQLLSTPRNDNLNLIGWLQNTPPLEFLTLASQSKSLQHLICVSNVQAFMLSYHPVFKKVIVLPNFVDVGFWGKASASREATRVTYVGALKEPKGFHLLADVWAEINRKYPEWELDVCGSPDLYGKHAKLGQHKIAEESYEKRILDPLGGTPASAAEKRVRFLGSLPKEKLREQLSRSSIIVVNPNAEMGYETFCVSAVEAEVMGLPVIGGRAGGLLETVGHNTGGLLSKSSQDLTANIIDLIEHPEKRIALGEGGRSQALQMFSSAAVLKKWRQFLLNNDISDIIPSGDEYKPKFYKLRSTLPKLVPVSLIKFLKKINRIRRHGFRN